MYTDTGRAQAYATCHPIHIADDVPHLGPGTALTHDDLADFAAVAQEQAAYAGFVPERLVFTQPNLIAWWRPAEKRHVWFATDDAIGERAGITEHPPLLFVASHRGWHVFALRKNARPTPESALFNAPYYNVWQGGRICTGSAQTPKAATPESIKGFEDAFFRSRFTHTNQPRLIKRKGGAAQLWVDLLDGATFPLSALIPADETLASAIHRISKGEK
ncbi:PRTRC system protein B [Pandoraea commovens]|uniref:PRTRC system protein B n=1 Tax=Pandoraea commovens TaxID=2508289 RepID=A0ABY5QI34_9BURK|nr:PRTRC system protein B [Pandoraea commovens]UVA80442.1 PRTRC system protein B [Pandoraea commovens]